MNRAASFFHSRNIEDRGTWALLFDFSVLKVACVCIFIAVTPCNQQCTLASLARLLAFGELASGSPMILRGSPPSCARTFAFFEWSRAQHTAQLTSRCSAGNTASGGDSGISARRPSRGGKWRELAKLPPASPRAEFMPRKREAIDWFIGVRGQASELMGRAASAEILRTA